MLPQKKADRAEQKSEMQKLQRPKSQLDTMTQSSSVIDAESASWDPVG